VGCVLLLVREEAVQCQPHHTERKGNSIERIQIIRQKIGIKRYWPRAKGTAPRITVLDTGQGQAWLVARARSE
jgi:hypothetical protein